MCPRGDMFTTDTSPPSDYYAIAFAPLLDSEVLDKYHTKLVSKSHLTYMPIQNRELYRINPIIYAENAKWW